MSVVARIVGAWAVRCCCWVRHRERYAKRPALLYSHHYHRRLASYAGIPYHAWKHAAGAGHTSRYVVNRNSHAVMALLPARPLLFAKASPPRSR